MFRGRFILAGACSAFLPLLLGLGCGGSERAPTSPAQGREHAEAGGDPKPAHEDEGSDTSSTRAARPATCDDGTCTPCGDALCPSGWYCDETAPGGPSCGWLPECAQKSGCACVKKALGCACEEKGGAAHIVCK
jgi:hypothetical protein